jgi:hypothetical protein
MAAAPKHEGAMSATVDGVRWESVVISAAAIQGGVLRIAGQDHLNAPFVALGIAVPPQVGTYTVTRRPERPSPARWSNRYEDDRER